MIVISGRLLIPYLISISRLDIITWTEAHSLRFYYLSNQYEFSPSRQGKDFYSKLYITKLVHLTEIENSNQVKKLGAYLVFTTSTPAGSETRASPNFLTHFVNTRLLFEYLTILQGKFHFHSLLLSNNILFIHFTVQSKH